MIPPQLPPHEQARLASLQRLAVLDTPAEPEFDALVLAASAICGAPVSLLSLVDAERQWFKAKVGLDGVAQTGREESFCGHAILDDTLFEVRDAREDPRFADNPLVLGETGIRFYAGAPVILSDGARVGTLCVIDRQPRSLDAGQREVLIHLSRAAARALEGRRALRQVGAALQEAAESALRARRDEERLRFVLEHLPSTLAYWDPGLVCRYANNTHLDWYDVQRDTMVGMHLRDLLGPEVFARSQPYIEAALAGQAQSFERTIRTRDGKALQTLVFYIPEIADGKVVGLLAQATDITQSRLDTEALQRFRDRAEQEGELARFLLSRMSRSESLNLPGVAHLWRPAESFSGDLISVAHSSAGDLYGMLADATGHGLAAALNLVPLTTTFYELAQKGFGLKTIAQRLNKIVRDYSPVDRFIAVTLIRFRARENQVEVINAGNPPALLIKPDCEVAREFPSGCTPLGVLDPQRFQPSVEQSELGPEDVVLLFSDGLIEALDRAGREFGLAGVQAALYAAGSTGQIVPALRDALDRHCAGEAPHDDVAVLALLGHALGSVASPEPVEDPLAAEAVSLTTREDRIAEDGDWQVSVSFGGPQLQRIDPVPAVMELTRSLEFDPQVESRLFTILSELVANALEHGLLELDSAIKHGPGGFERYFELRDERLAALTSGRLAIRVRHWQAGAASGHLRIEVQDSGPGFDHVGLLARLPGKGASGAELLPSGRGIALVAALSDEIHFGERGNLVSCEFRYG